MPIVNGKSKPSSSDASEPGASFLDDLDDLDSFIDNLGDPLAEPEVESPSPESSPEPAQDIQPAPKPQPQPKTRPASESAAPPARPVRASRPRSPEPATPVKNVVKNTTKVMHPRSAQSSAAVGRSRAAKPAPRPRPTRAMPNFGAHSSKTDEPEVAPARRPARSHKLDPDAAALGARDDYSYWIHRDAPVVGRAEHKLAAAIRQFGFSFKDKTVLDIGSSTGGFTELALHSGAKRVVAVEKGTNQMATPLRHDPRIDLREKTDIFTVTSRQLPKLDVVLADVSFISLTKILNYVAREIVPQGRADLLVMLKPQFEATPSQLTRGVVKNEKIRREIIKNFEIWLRRQGFVVVQKHDNDLPGRHGNRERFYWLRLSKTNFSN